MNSNTCTRFYTLTGDDFSFEVRRGTRSLCGRACLSNGSFTIDTCSFNLLQFRDEIDIIISVLTNLVLKKDEKSR